MKILFLAHYYPPSPQRFIAEELHAWERHGLTIDVFAFRRPSQERMRLLPSDEAVDTARYYLTEIPRKMWWRGLMKALSRPGASARAFGCVLAGRFANHSTTRLRLQAALACFRSLPVIGLLIDSDYTWVHTDFADDTATVAWIANMITGTPFSFRDHFSFNPQLIERKVYDAALALPCCDANRRALLERVTDGAPVGERVRTLYLGIDVNRWMSSGASQIDPPAIVCVGTLQQKKGQSVLVDACKTLIDRGYRFQCTLIGDGPLRSELEGQISSLSLEGVVAITGFASEEIVKEAIERCTIFCLPSVVTEDGDSDGIPIALMEAMAMERPCVSTEAGGIGELITNDVDGLLVRQRSVPELADALSRLLDDASVRERLGQTARTTIAQRFDLERNSRVAVELLRSVAR